MRKHYLLWAMHMPALEETITSLGQPTRLIARGSLSNTAQCHSVLSNVSDLLTDILRQASTISLSNQQNRVLTSMTDSAVMFCD